MSSLSRVFTIISNDAACIALLGNNPTRLFPAGIANKQSPKPYATYGVPTAIPQNYLDKPADMDQIGVQIDIYGDTMQAVDDVLQAIREALEPVENKINIGGFSVPDRDGETNLYHARLEADVWESR